MKILWTQNAQKSFDIIVDYLQKEWSLNSAIKFVRKTNIFLKTLSQQPEIGKKENPKKDLRSFVLTRHTTIFYRIKNESTIVILAFFDSRQNPSKKPK